MTILMLPRRRLELLSHRLKARHPNHCATEMAKRRILNSKEEGTLTCVIVISGDSQRVKESPHGAWVTTVTRLASLATDPFDLVR